MADEPLSREEVLTSLKEMFDNIVEMQNRVNQQGAVIERLRLAGNTHAEIAGLHRYLLERFIPAPTLTAAVNEYSELRAKVIEQQRLEELGVSASKTGH